MTFFIIIDYTGFPHRENNCQELKKETEDKIQTLVTDHKAKVRQKKQTQKVLALKTSILSANLSAVRTNRTLAVCN